ncbi:serine/threonine-protein kinase Chk1 [Vairimorpha necatrix]|uniref:non-specific serine/threonine protein kinase n=1 Tax=Vairimorpha necatrix TaxID=6039 RepID=A0AAX4JFJ1_9MICR
MNNLFKIQETLASGSTSKVKKILTIDNKEYALKIMPKCIKDSKSFIKEISIHKSLINTNIIKYIDSYEDLENYYLVMELAKFELHGFIECDIGINPSVVHFLIKQLISGIEYLHNKGICHRDIKPENLLIDSNGTLLISDFGYSTFFRYKGKYRRLKALAGSKEYISPEVANENYDGELCDIWSIGVLLIVLLTGTLPWECPVLEDQRFKTYISMKYHYYPPFTKIRGKILHLIRNILVAEKKRFNINKLKNHPWVLEETTVNKSNIFRLMPIKENFDILFTQPNNINKTSFKTELKLSQPIDNCNQISEQHRFYKNGKIEEVKREIVDLLKYMVVPHDIIDDVITFNTTDTKRGILRGKVFFTKVEDCCYITIRKLKGDYNEFKKFLGIFGENYDEDC